MKIQTSNIPQGPELSSVTPRKADSRPAGQSGSAVPADVVSFTPIAMQATSHQAEASGKADKLAALKAVVNAPGYTPPAAAVAKKLIDRAITGGE